MTTVLTDMMTKSR